MENQKRLTVIENNLKIALQNLELLKEEQEETELSLINERLNKLEETLEQVKKAIIWAVKLLIGAIVQDVGLR